jgi:gluconate kinase
MIIGKEVLTVVIFVGGLPGAGKSSIARFLAERFFIHYYDVDEVKKVVYPQDPDFQYNMEHGIPFKEETRLRVFEKVVSDFEHLAESHAHLVVDETLHLKKPRRVLFNAAKDYFGGYVIVWVKTDEAVAIGRLSGKERDHHILKDPMKMVPSFAKAFEPFDESYIVCHNNGSLEEATESLFSLIQNMTSLINHVQKRAGSG